MPDTLLDSGAPAAPAATATTPATTEPTPPTGEPTNETTDPTDAGDANTSIETENGEPTEPKPDGNDWAAVRTRIANGDEKVLNRLSRYGTLDEAIKAGVEAQNKIAAGMAKGAKVPTSESTEAEIKAYREANGVPDTPKDYKIELPDGFVLGEADQPVADAFVEVAHKHNLPPAAVNEIIAKQLEYQNSVMAEQQQADDKQKVFAEETLMSDEVWGSEAPANINMINQMLSSAPSGVKEQLMSARLTDGTLLGNDVNTLRWLSTTARTLNPYATVTPNAGQSSAETVSNELAKLNTMMGDKTSEYWKGPNADTNQKKYRDLIAMQELSKGNTRK